MKIVRIEAVEGLLPCASLAFLSSYSCTRSPGGHT